MSVHVLVDRPLPATDEMDDFNLVGFAQQRALPLPAPDNRPVEFNRDLFRFQVEDLN